MFNFQYACVLSVTAGILAITDCFDPSRKFATIRTKLISFGRMAPFFENKFHVNTIDFVHSGFKRLFDDKVDATR